MELCGHPRRRVPVDWSCRSSQTASGGGSSQRGLRRRIIRSLPEHCAEKLVGFHQGRPSTSIVLIAAVPVVVLPYFTADEDCKSSQVSSHWARLGTMTLRPTGAFCHLECPNAQGTLR